MSRREEGGFTLIEIVVVVVILGLVGATLTGAFVEGVNATASASTSLGSSRDTQLTDYYLERDALGGTVSYPATASATWACATGAGVSVGVIPPNQGVIQFNWSQADVYAGSALPSGDPNFTSGASYEADYVYQGTKLIRYFCTLTSGGASAGTKAITVASSLSSTQAPTALPSDTSTCNPSGACSSDCDAGAQSGSCTAVDLFDSSGKEYTVVLLNRSFGQS